MFDIVSLRYPIIMGKMLSEKPDAQTSNTLDCIDAFNGYLPNLDALREETQFLTRPLSSQ